MLGSSVENLKILKIGIYEDSNASEINATEALTTQRRYRVFENRKNTRFKPHQNRINLKHQNTIIIVPYKMVFWLKTQL